MRVVFQMESFLKSHESNLPLPPSSGEDTIFEFVVDDKGQWEHWNNRVFVAFCIVYTHIYISFHVICFLFFLSHVSC